MKRIISFILTIAAALSLCACGNTKPEALHTAPEAPDVLYTDDCSRSVAIPAELTAIAPSGNVATMILATIAPERLVCSGAVITDEQSRYLPAGMAELPVTGQLYGGKSTLNMESLLATGAEIVIDLGDYVPSAAEDLDALQEQIGIPCVFIEADLPHLAEAYRKLGALLGVPERGEALASLVEETLAMAEENAAKIDEKDRLSVLYATGPDPLGTNAAGSSQAQVLELVGAVNAVQVDNVTSKGGGNLINMEQLYNFDPDVVLVTEDAAYEILHTDPAWQSVTAVETGACRQIPCEPYCWLSSPPSVNMVLGIWWLGNLLYPQIYDYDMAAKAQEIYKLLWDHDLTEEECARMLERSTAKVSN